MIWIFLLGVEFHFL